MIDIMKTKHTSSAKDISSFNYFLIFGITLQYLVLLESVWYYLNSYLFLLHTFLRQVESVPKSEQASEKVKKRKKNTMSYGRPEKRVEN